MGRDVLGVLDGSAVLKVRGDAGRAEGVAAGRRRQGASETLNFFFLLPRLHKARYENNPG